MNNNKLHDVPDDVCELVSLHTFLASDNEIAHLPHDFGRLVAMQVLMSTFLLAGAPYLNYFVPVVKWLFSGPVRKLFIYSTKVLDLTRNNLTELPDSVFPIEVCSRSSPSLIAG